MAKPYDLYTRFLITKGYDDLNIVNQNLKSLNLNKITQAEFDVQYSYVENLIPKGILKQIENKVYGSDFLGWMRELEVDEFWFGEKRFLNPKFTPLIKLVYDIHEDLRLRLTINCLLIKNMGRGDLAQSLAGKYSTLLKEEHIILYEKYFFNPARMKRQDWKSFIIGQQDEEKSTYFVALTEDIEILKGELDLTAKINVSEILQYHLAGCHKKAKTFMRINTPEAGREAREWIKQIVMLTDKFEKYRSGDTDDFANAIQMEFDFVETDFANLDETILAEIKEEADPTKKQAENEEAQNASTAKGAKKNRQKEEKTPLDLSSV